MPVKRWLVPVIVLVTLFGSVYVGKALGWWQTSGQTLTSVKDVTTADIKGSSTLGDVSTAFGIPLDELRGVLGLPADIPATTQMKELEAYIEVSVARDKIAAYLGQADAAAEEPPSSTPEASAPTATHAPQAEATPLPAGEVLPAAEIKGRMTLQEVSEQCGIPLDVLYEALKLKADVPATTALKDLQTLVPDLEMSVVRDIVAAYQAKP